MLPSAACWLISIGDLSRLGWSTSQELICTVGWLSFCASLHEEYQPWSLSW